MSSQNRCVYYGRGERLTCSGMGHGVWCPTFIPSICRYVVVPTVTVLAVMKARLQGATKGHALLKKKADALNMRFRQILKKIVQTKEEMGDLMKASFFSLAQAKYASGDFRHSVIDGIEHVSSRGAWCLGLHVGSRATSAQDATEN